MSQNYSYTTPNNHNIDITTYGNSNLINGNCLVFVHGFKGFKDWGFCPYLGSYFSEKGYFVITFNFSHNGVAKNSINFDELDKFANNTFSKEIEEINLIIKLYQDEFFGVKNKYSKIGLLGHSRGGGDAIIAASINNRISALVTWSAIAKIDRYSERQKKEWREKGYFEITNARTKQIMRLNKILLDDIEENKDNSLSIKKALSKINIPYLIVHGDQDLAVPINEAEQIYLWSNKEKTEFFKISGTGHTFEIKHPFEGSSKPFDNVLEKTLHFFNKHFSETY